MTLAPLATADDLTARNIAVPAGVDVSTALEQASADVREAAGCPIVVTTSTVTLVARDLYELALPGGPVRSVASVTVDGVPLTGWDLFADTLVFPCAWTDCLPKNVVVTYTHGLTVIPEDIIGLVCGLAAMAFRQDGDYAGAGRDSMVKLGDYAERESVPAGAASPSPTAIPDAVRNRLRARFGTSIAVLDVRR